MKRPLNVAAQSETSGEGECPVDDAVSARAELLDDALRRVCEGQSPDGILADQPAVRPLLDLALAISELAPRAPDSTVRIVARQRLERLVAARRRPTRLTLLRRSMQLAAAVLAISLIVAGTVRVADASLPDSAIYPVKMAAEAVQLRLAVDEAANEQLRFAFAQRRLSEWEALQQRQVDVDDLSAATERAIDATDRLAQSAQAEMWPRVASLVERQQTALQQEQARAPEHAAGNVARALDVSRRGLLHAGEAMDGLKEKSADDQNKATGESGTPRETQGASSRGGSRPAGDAPDAPKERPLRGSALGGQAAQLNGEATQPSRLSGQESYGQAIKANAKSSVQLSVDAVDGADVEDGSPSEPRSASVGRRDVSPSARGGAARDRDVTSPASVASSNSDRAQSGGQSASRTSANGSRQDRGSSTVKERSDSGGRSADRPVASDPSAAVISGVRGAGDGNSSDGAAKAAAIVERVKSEGRQDLTARGAGRR